VLIRFEGNYGAVNIEVMGDRSAFVAKPMPQHNFIDKARPTPSLRKMRDSPHRNYAPMTSSCAAFYLDLTGNHSDGRIVARSVYRKPRSQPGEAGPSWWIPSLEAAIFVAFLGPIAGADLLQCKLQDAGRKKERGFFREWIREFGGAE